KAAHAPVYRLTVPLWPHLPGLRHLPPWRVPQFQTRHGVGRGLTSRFFYQNHKPLRPADALEPASELGTSTAQSQQSSEPQNALPLESCFPSLGKFNFYVSAQTTASNRRTQGDRHEHRILF